MGVTRTVQYRRHTSDSYFGRSVRPAFAVLGALLSLVGFVLALDGYLLPEGSAFYVLAGSVLVVSGALLFWRAEDWTHMLGFARAVSCSLRNLSVDSSLAARLIGILATAHDRAVGSPDCLRYPIFGCGNERIFAMIYDWQTSLRANDYSTTRIVPPAAVEETGWDILLALHSDRDCRLDLRKLASVVSVPNGVIDRWLGALEERELITGAEHPSTGELLAVLTDKGRELLDRYFSAANDLQVGAHH